MEERKRIVRRTVSNGAVLDQSDAPHPVLERVLAARRASGGLVNHKGLDALL